MKTILYVVPFWGLFACACIAQSATDTLIVGTWKGSSLCQVKNSPCHDETVIYRISKGAAEGTYNIVADKLVNGVAENMGELPCRYDDEKRLLVSDAYRSNWMFQVKEGVMEGKLIFNNQLYRLISLKKVY